MITYFFFNDFYFDLFADRSDLSLLFDFDDMFDFLEESKLVKLIKFFDLDLDLLPFWDILLKLFSFSTELDLDFLFGVPYKLDNEAF